MVCGVGNYTQWNHLPSYKCLLSNIYSLYLHPCVQDIYLLLVGRWCCSKNSNRSLIAAQVCKYLLAFFIYLFIYFFNLFPKPLSLPPVIFSSKSLPFITLSTGQSHDLQSHVTCTLCILTLVGVIILILPAFITTSPLTYLVQPRSELHCHPITRFVVALMDVRLWWRKAILKASRLLPAPWTGHATTIMVFSLLIYSDHPRNPDHHQISHAISIVPLGPPHKVSSVSVHNYLSNIA